MNLIKHQREKKRGRCRHVTEWLRGVSLLCAKGRPLHNRSPWRRAIPLQERHTWCYLMTRRVNPRQLEGAEKKIWRKLSQADLGAVTSCLFFERSLRKRRAWKARPIHRAHGSFALANGSGPPPAPTDFHPTPAHAEGNQKCIKTLIVLCLLWSNLFKDTFQCSFQF